MREEEEGMGGWMDGPKGEADEGENVSEGTVITGRAWRTSNGWVDDREREGEERRDEWRD